MRLQRLAAQHFSQDDLLLQVLAALRRSDLTALSSNGSTLKVLRKAKVLFKTAPPQHFRLERLALLFTSIFVAVIPLEPPLSCGPILWNSQS